MPDDRDASAHAGERRTAPNETPTASVGLPEPAADHSDSPPTSATPVARGSQALSTAMAQLGSWPPGTGKTMAREAMAALRTLEAYRSEFSQTISRFIDGTSKNFANVFAKAEGQANDLFSGPPDSQHEAPTRFRKERSRWQLLVRARRTRRPEEDETDDPMLTPN